ncbi:MAG: hypothetical protein F6K39_12175 [Okeania sp. SIO3B3]|nr:hypothetical protein [Okeania sp. SIO3B3]
MSSRTHGQFVTPQEEAKKQWLRILKSDRIEECDRRLSKSVKSWFHGADLFFKHLSNF